MTRLSHQLNILDLSKRGRGVNLRVEMLIKTSQALELGDTYISMPIICEATIYSNMLGKKFKNIWIEVKIW